jgi:hypothetical protein
MRRGTGARSAWDRHPRLTRHSRAGLSFPFEAGLGGVRIFELRLDAIEVRYGEKQIPRFALNDKG